MGCQSRTGQAKTDFGQVVAERAASGGKRLFIGLTSYFPTLMHTEAKPLVCLSEQRLG